MSNFAFLSVFQQLLRRFARRIVNKTNTKGAFSMPVLQVGDTAPAFSVLTHTGDTLTLSSLQGKKILLWFYPKADTPG